MEAQSAIHTLEPILAEHPFFKDITPDNLTLLTECAANERFAAGALLCREGEAADKFYLIRTGMAAIQFYAPNQGAVTIQTLQAGDVVGWSWLIPPYRWHFDVRAVEAVRAISLDAACIRRKCDRDPQLGFTLMTKVSHLLAARLMSVRLQLVSAYEEIDGK